MITFVLTRKNKFIRMPGMARTNDDHNLKETANAVCGFFEREGSFPTARGLAQEMKLSTYGAYYRILRAETGKYLIRNQSGKIINAKRDLQHFWLIQVLNRE